MKDDIKENVIDLIPLLNIKRSEEKKKLKALRKDTVACLREIDERIARTSMVVPAPKAIARGKTRQKRGRIVAWNEEPTTVRKVVADR